MPDAGPEDRVLTDHRGMYLTSPRFVFHNAPVTPDKLGLLSDEELHVLADHMGLNLPQDLDRVFMLEEIVEAFNEESEERRTSHDAPGHVEEKKFSVSGFGSGGSTPSSTLRVGESGDRYGETLIHAISRDPGWVFAYWDIAERHRETVRDDVPAPLCLRVCEVSAGKDPKKDFFDIPVSGSDYQWYINLPHPGARYRIDLYMQHGGKMRLMARSNEVTLPRMHLGKALDESSASELRLFELSGGKDCTIIPADPASSPDSPMAGE